MYPNQPATQSRVSGAAKSAIGQPGSTGIQFVAEWIPGELGVPEHAQADGGHQDEDAARDGSRHRDQQILTRSRHE